MKEFLSRFEEYCKTPGVTSGKASSYKKAIEYLCEYLKISTIDDRSVSMIKQLENEINDKNSEKYKDFLFFLTQAGRKSYLVDGYVKASLKYFFPFFESQKTYDKGDNVTVFEEGEKEMTVKDQLAQIKEYIAMKGFSYEGNLIDNFWLSLKSKPFVLLAGTSGTGKTRLVRLFAEAIGATNENGRYKLVSVRPDWSDSSDLFGHVDLNGHFVAGAIIDFVKKAELDPEYPYFLCLDEMNLARVEYYLSDFLSVIETRERKDETIVTDPLVNPSCYGRDAVAAGKYGKVILPENLYVIGTVNMDETTFPFSRKVLDRANTIEFSFVKPNELPGSDDGDVDALNLGNEFLKTEYLSLKECMSEDANFQVLCDKLEEINLILAKAGAHVGYRVRDEIVFYLLNNKKNGLLSAEEAFDNEIMQKILPRIQGSSTSVKNMLCELFRYCAGDYTGLGGSSDSEQMQAYLDQKSAGKYPRSAEKIVFMTRRFEEDGFTSYWL